MPAVLTSRRRLRILGAAILIVAVLAYVAAPYVRAASLFIRAAPGRCLTRACALHEGVARRRPHGGDCQQPGARRHGHAAAYRADAPWPGAGAVLSAGGGVYGDGPPHPRPPFRG